MRSLGCSLALALVSAACSEPAPLPLDADRAFEVGPCNQNDNARVFPPCHFRAGGDTDGDERGDYLFHSVAPPTFQVYGDKGEPLYDITTAKLSSSGLALRSIISAVIVGDADGDALDDILAMVFVDASSHTWILMSGAELHVLSVFDLPVATSIDVGPDATGDGLVDVLVGPLQGGPTAGDLVLYTGLGEEVRRWSAEDSLLEDASGSALSGDIDGDGLADIVLTRTDGRISLHSGVDASPLGEIIDDSRSVWCLGDTDSDGAADFLTRDRDDGYRIRTYSGRTQELLLDSDDGAFGGYGHQYIHLGPDANGDDAADILTWGEDRDPDTAEVLATLATLWSGATGEPIARWSYPSGPDHVVLWTPDLGPDVNGDGLADVTFLAQDLAAWPEGPLDYSLYVYYSSSFLGRTYD